MQPATSHQLAGHSFILSLAPKVILLCDSGAKLMEKMSNNRVLEKPATKEVNSGKTVSETEETVRQLRKHQRRGKFQKGKIFFRGTS